MKNLNQKQQALNEERFQIAKWGAKKLNAKNIFDEVFAQQQLDIHTRIYLSI